MFIDVIDVDEHLEAHSIASSEPILLVGPLGCDDRNLRLSAAQSDVARIALGWKLKVTLEPEFLVERGGPRDMRSEDDREGSGGDWSRLCPRLRQCAGMPVKRSTELALMKRAPSQGARVRYSRLRGSCSVT